MSDTGSRAQYDKTSQSTARSWHEIAGEMTHEQNSDRLLQLAPQLNQVMESEERKRLGLDSAV